MRKITKQAVEAFLNHKPFNSGNTSVVVSPIGVTMFLHGNAIAEDIYGSLRVSSAGWETSTTKERLNGLPGVSVCQSKGQWYLNGKKWENSKEWTEV